MLYFNKKIKVFSCYNGWRFHYKVFFSIVWSQIHHEVVDSTQTPASEVPFPHPSIQPADAKFDVERCHGNSCNCGKFHCVLCPVEKPPMKHRSKALIHAKLHTNHYVELEGKG